MMLTGLTELHQPDLHSVQNQQFVTAPRKDRMNFIAAYTAFCQSRRKCLNGSIETCCKTLQYITYCETVYFGHTFQNAYTCTKNNATVYTTDYHVKCDHVTT